MQKPPVITAHNYVMLTLALAFFVGCRFALNFTQDAWPWLVFALGIALLPLRRKLDKSIYIALALCSLSIGIMLTHHALTPIAPTPGHYEVTGYVYGDPTIRDDGRITFTLTDISLDGAMQDGRAYCSIYLNGEEMPAVFDGAALRFDGRVYLPDGKSGAPHFDFRLWLLQNNMTFGIASSNELTTENTPETAPVKDWALRIRKVFSKSLTRTMGDNSRLAMAMLFSDREGLATDESEAFSKLGIAHVLSVSGLHIGLIAGIIVWILKKCRVPVRHRPPIIAAFLFVYAALAGFSPASVRASIMCVLYAVASVLVIHPDPLAILANAMLLILFFNPLQAHSASFTLSFSALAGITLLEPVFMNIFVAINRRRRLPKRDRMKTRWARIRIFFGKPPKPLGSGIALSLAAQIGVMIPTAITFHSLPLYGVLINLLVVPYMGFLIPIYLLALAASPIPWLGQPFGFIASQMSDLLLWAIGLLSTLPYASIRVPAVSPLLIFAFFMIVLLISRRTYAPRMQKVCAIALICLVAAIGTYTSQPASLRYIQLAVGQADASLLMDNDLTIAIDVGDDGEAAVDYLLDEGRNIDALYLTHLHLDHALGIHHLIESGIKIKQIYLPVNAAGQGLSEESLTLYHGIQSLGIPITELAAGDQLRYNETVIDVLWPTDTAIRSGHDANDMPLVLRIDFGGYTLLSTSDINGTYEAYAAAPCDVLKVSHHGSSKSTSDQYLDFVSPKIAMISCSSGSRSLPGTDTLERLTSHQIPIFRTDEAGDITITIKDGQLCVTPYKARINE